MAMTDHKRAIFVYADWDGLGGPQKLGSLYSERIRGKEVFLFEYEERWLQSGNAQWLDPDLQLYTGVQYLSDQRKSNFGLFLDSAPDRWGRLLIRRKEAAMARREGRPESHLYETDYLLRVLDAQRMGALRFKTEMNGPFLNNDIALASPPWTSIRELESISLRLEDDDAVDDPDYLQWLNVLLVPGSSLGGARPKAGVVDTRNQLWIAKFPSKNDPSDMGGWEMVTHELALAAGVNKAEAQAAKFSTDHHTFLTRRFDRTDTGKRKHFASAMTLLGHTDGEDYGDGLSYLELVEFLVSRGARVNEDLEELWRRIVFSICVSNTDDHLRNHGFLLQRGGWVLSPAYDINPVETANGLKLNISENDNALDLDLAMEVIPYFRLKETKAREIIGQVKTAVGNWRKVASKYGISRTAQELKSRAFSRAES